MRPTGGEIDLLACVAPTGTREQPAGSALVVDYKTGGSPAETAEQLHEKHLLQATCYAYAVLMEGYAQVECVFVRVEQDRADAPGQPQTVSYRFDAASAVRDGPRPCAGVSWAQSAVGFEGRLREHPDFGTKKSFDTKKAQRYFKERRISFQFIDLKEKGMSDKASCGRWPTPSAALTS